MIKLSTAKRNVCTCYPLDQYGFTCWKALFRLCLLHGSSRERNTSNCVKNFKIWVSNSQITKKKINWNWWFDQLERASACHLALEGRYIRGCLPLQTLFQSEMLNTHSWVPTLLKRRKILPVVKIVLFRIKNYFKSTKNNFKWL